MKPAILDLFGCAGGAADGYAEAGFDVHGVDIEPQKHYPYPFYQGDALAVLRHARKRPGGRIEWGGITFDAVHASPPCQGYCPLTNQLGSQDNHVRMIPGVRALLQRLDVPYVIENVEGARHELNDPLMLCGAMDEFPELRVIRHRYFELGGFTVPQPEHRKHPLCHTLDKRKAHYGKLDEMTAYVQVYGGGHSSVKAARDAMGMNHRPEVTKKELNQAIPPAYSRYIGKHLIEQI